MQEPIRMRMMANLRAVPYDENPAQNGLQLQSFSDPVSWVEAHPLVTAIAMASATSTALRTRQLAMAVPVERDEGNEYY